MVRLRLEKPEPEYHRSLYRALLRHALFRFSFLYFIPLLMLTLFFHLQYRIIANSTFHSQTSSKIFNYSIADT